MTSPEFHAGLAAGRWRELSLVEQLGNVGSEVGRASRAKTLGNEGRFAASFERALELFDLTLADERWAFRRKEIARAREVVCDFLVGDNQYNSTADWLDAYFLSFAVAARNVGGPGHTGRSIAAGSSKPPRLEGRPRTR